MYLCDKCIWHVYVILQVCISTCGFVTYVAVLCRHLTYHLALAMGVLGGALLASTPTLTTPRQVKSLTSAVRWKRIYTH